MLEASPLHLEYLAVIAPLGILFALFCISARLDYVRDQRNQVQRALTRNKKTYMVD